MILKKTFWGALLSLLGAYLVISCKAPVYPLPASMTVYPGDLEELLHLDPPLENIISLEKEVELVRTKAFTLTNFYIIPVAYFEMGWDSTQLKSFGPERLAGQIEFIVKREALEELLYRKSVDEAISLSEDEFNKRAALEESTQSRPPYTKEFAHHRIKRKMMINKLYEKITSSITVSNEEVEAYFNANRDFSHTPKRAVVRMIFMDKGKSDEEDRDILIKMKNIHKRAVSGENFITLAKRFSEDKGSLYSGGRLGEYIEKGSTYSDFEEKVLHHPAGTITPVFKTNYGYYIVKIEKVIEPQPRDISTVRKYIVSALREKKRLRMISNLKKELAEEYELKILL